MNNDFDTSRLIYLLLILVLFVPAWLRMSGKGSEKLRNALIWFIIIIALTIGWAVFNPQTFPLPGLHPTGLAHEI